MNLKLAQALKPRAMHGNTLVMRSSAGPFRSPGALAATTLCLTMKTIRHRSKVCKCDVERDAL